MITSRIYLSLTNSAKIALRRTPGLRRFAPPGPGGADGENLAFVRDPDAVPDHVEDTVQAILHLTEQHQAQATPAQRFFDRATAGMASARFIVGLGALMCGWMLWNLLAPLFGVAAFDAAPFDALQGLATLLALFATILILATQRREDRIATDREHVALQLAMLNDRKLAKVIALLEEQRRDHPGLRNRIDQEAEAMAEPADPRHVLDAMRDY